ncbi:Group XII secretory phospholipase A2 precursor, partial [Trinorchestia longiramus]
KFVDSNIEEDCEFECPRGSRPLPDSSHVPSSNGCGSMGFSISGEKLPYSQMGDCCNEHDICYDTCNSNKEVCDVKFKRCLYAICKSTGNIDMLSEKTCKASSKLLFTSTLSLGCLSFKEAQRKACKCVPV